MKWIVGCINTLFEKVFGIRLVRISRKGASEKIPYENILPVATYSPWNLDNEFIQIYNRVREYTMLDIYRCYELWALVEQVGGLEGDILEVGAWRGGSSAFIAKKSEMSHSSTTVYVCDTFKGIVKAGENDPGFINGDLSDTSIEIVKDLLSNQLELNNVSLHMGIFPDDMKGILDDKKFKLCHIDVDVYESAQDIFNWVWGRCVMGGMVIFDDYGFHNCAGITRLVDELKYNSDNLMIHNLNGHAILIKLTS